MKPSTNGNGLRAALSLRLSCAVLGPEDAGYASEVAAFNTAIRHAPDLVVCAASAADIAEAVRFAGEKGVRVSVQGAGHGAHAAISRSTCVDRKT